MLNNQLVDRTLTNDSGEFNSAVNATFCPMVCMPITDAACGFQAELLNTRLDRIHLARIGTSALEVLRRKQDIAQVAGDASYLVKFQLEGQGLVQHRGREAHLQRGDFVICTTSEPYRLLFEDTSRQAAVAIPHPVLNSMFKMPEDYLGLKMSGQSPVHGLLSQFIQSLVERIDQLDPSIIQRLEANILDLLVTSLHAESSQAAVSEVDKSSKAEQQVSEIKRFIAMNLRDYQLSVDLIADAMGISKRYLHLLFQNEGVSVSRYIQQQRLEASYRALTSPDRRLDSTTDIAYEFGFSDLSHFYRCFKARYTITPGKLRDQGDE